MKPFVVFTTPPANTGQFLHDNGPIFTFAPGTFEGRPAMIAQVDESTIANGHGGRLILERPNKPPISQRGRLRTAGTFDERVEFLADDFTFGESPFDPFRLPRLIRRGQFLALETGERFTAIEASDFNLLARWLKEGPEAVDPVIRQRAELGFNLRRVWTHMQLSQYGIGDLNPADFPDFYERIPSFCGHLAAHGQYVEFTAYTGEPGRHDLEHWPRLGAAAQRCSNAILELVNEQDQHTNGVDLSKFSPIPGVLCSHGSNGSEAWPVDPPWDYETFHTNGAFEWQRKTGHNAMEIADARGRPVIANENTRFEDNDSSETHAEDAAEGGALLCAGACYHSGQGKNSSLFTGRTLACAQAWTRGARSVPLEFQDGRYIRHDDFAAPVIRKYERRLNDGRGHIIEIRA